MTTLGIITDAHANLPALIADVGALERAGCETIVHCGDAIGFGPHPAECLDLLLHRPNTHLLMGNHDEWFAHGLPTPRPARMSEGEWEHQRWTHAQIPADARAIVAAWPYVRHLPVSQTVTAAFCHYPRNPGNSGFAPIARNPTPPDLDDLFMDMDADLIFYGHHHPRSDLQGKARYVNPGALGCNRKPEARYAIIESSANGKVTLSLGAAPHDWNPMLADFDRREVPERDAIRRSFYGQP